MDQAPRTQWMSRALSAHAVGTRERKAVGEACGFPYRLITNCPSLPLRTMGEAEEFLAAVVSEFDAVPEWRWLLPSALQLPVPWQWL
jgi:hypothetical protein